MRTGEVSLIRVFASLIAVIRSAANFEHGEQMAALQDIQAAQATKAYPEHLHYKLSLRWKGLVVLNMKSTRTNV